VVHLPNFAPDPNPSGDGFEPEDYFLYVGVLEPHKGVSVLAEAASRSPRARFKVVGRGSLRPRLEDLHDRGSGRVEVEGWVSRERLSNLYRHASGIIIPSLWHENAPLVAVEALAWGTPLLVSRRGGLEELLYSRTTGRAFEPTPEHLAGAVGAFLDDDLAHRLRAGAREAYVANHRPDEYVDRYTELVKAPRVATPVRAEARTSTGERISAVPEAGLSGGVP
jgi:glycosyltransferase involved in cell wall biosynthesis